MRLTAWMRWVLVLLFLASPPGAAGAVQAPAIEAAREGLTISHLPAILNETEVRK